MSLVVAALLTIAVSGSAPAADRDDVVANITDERIPESSALVQSTVDPDLAYTVNDSGDGPYVYVLDLASGDVVGVTTLADVEVTDVEALAIGADDRLYVADVGDNAAERDDLALHALDQPGRGDLTVAVQTYPIRHRGGPQDVESLLIDPADGTAYLVIKGLLGGEVRRLPDLLEGRRVVSRPVADIAVPGLVTDAAYLPDGSGVVLRTYVGAVVYAMPGWEPLGEVRLPVQRQGESLAVVDGGPILYVGTEGLPSPIRQVRIPRDIWRELHPAPVEAVAGSDDAVGTQPTTAAGDSTSSVAVVAGSAGLVAVLGTLWLLTHHRRKR
ncbi:MAG: hypothetical protein M3419_10515 [Actinomycetota bacterium]|nr:hypothetical protein [Actinomycetota bacterium]